MNPVDDPLYQQRDLKPHEAYYLRCYYGEEPPGKAKKGDLAIEVRLLNKAALFMEIQASRARQQRREIGEITIHISVLPRYRSLHR